MEEKKKIKLKEILILIALFLFIVSIVISKVFIANPVKKEAMDTYYKYTEALVLDNKNMDEEFAMEQEMLEEFGILKGYVVLVKRNQEYYVFIEDGQVVHSQMSSYYDAPIEVNSKKILERKSKELYIFIELV